VRRGGPLGPPEIKKITRREFGSVIAGSRAFTGEHHAEITNLHLEDRKKDQGDNVPWGQGDTPIRETLQPLRRERWPIRGYVEYEHRGQAGPVDEVKQCAAFARQALA
jgi:hypothetical protein